LSCRRCRCSSRKAPSVTLEHSIAQAIAKPLADTRSDAGARAAAVDGLRRYGARRHCEIDRVRAVPVGREPRVVIDPEILGALGRRRIVRCGVDLAHEPRPDLRGSGPARKAHVSTAVVADPSDYEVIAAEAGEPAITRTVGR